MLESRVTSSFPEVYKLILLFVAIPVTVTAARRSFAKLKFIRTYLRSAVREKRLDNLGNTFYWKHRSKDDCMTNSNHLTGWNLTGVN